MAEGRRPRAATEEKRRRILDATEEIMLKEGYAAVSSRSVATAVGIQAPLVHYYFATLDDLFVAVLQRLAFSAVQDDVAGYATSADEAIAAMGRLVDRLEARRTKRLGR